MILSEREVKDAYKVVVSKNRALLKKEIKKLSTDQYYLKTKRDMGSDRIRGGSQSGFSHRAAIVSMKLTWLYFIYNLHNRGRVKVIKELELSIEHPIEYSRNDEFSRYIDKIKREILVSLLNSLNIYVINHLELTNYFNSYKHATVNFLINDRVDY